MAQWEVIYSFIVGNFWAAAVVVLALIGAALSAYAQDQIRTGTNWVLRPIANHLPWNRVRGFANLHGDLSSAYTLVQVFLLDAGGQRARYEKTTSFIVHRPTISYKEAVTAECAATAFTTMRGAIVDTVTEHGFHVSTIDLGNTAEEGERLTNVYSAYLLNSFAKPHEHWTQEFTCPTEHFTLQLHFPVERPPKSLACKILEGASERPAPTTGRLVDLFGRRAIVWDVASPRLSETLKLEWVW